VTSDSGQSPRPPGYLVVIPTVGRPSLQACLTALAAASGPRPCQVVLADDRRSAVAPLPVTAPQPLADRTVTVAVGGRGPAAARNAGWRASSGAEWIVFLDDDVQVGPCWADELAADLAGLPGDVAAVQGSIEVPRPPARRPTEWERDTIALERSRWVTADMAYRRIALAGAGGFDERFPAAFREDSDLALRLLDLGWALRHGSRRTRHPVRPAGRWMSLRTTDRYAADAAMTRLHGMGWRGRAGESLSWLSVHVVTCALGVASPALLAAGRRRAAAQTAVGWLAMTGGFAVARIIPGPGTLPEIAAMTVTSAAIPPLAVGHYLAGRWRWRRAGPWPPRAAGRQRLKAEVKRPFDEPGWKRGLLAITADMKDACWKVGKNTVVAVTAEMGLAARLRKNRRATTRPVGGGHRRRPGLAWRRRNQVSPARTAAIASCIAMSRSQMRGLCCHSGSGVLPGGGGVT
jgi:hypothetical protein